MVTPEPPDVERVLSIAAHPDDIEFGMAGTAATWTDAGVHVTYCIVTDGDAGGSDPSISRAEMAELRRAEQTTAAKVVGVTDLVFLGYPDGRVAATLDLRRDLARVIRQVRPDRVMAPSPERNWQRIYPSHPDHLAVGEAALCAVYPDARNPFAHPELLEEGHEPWIVPEVWVGGGVPPPDRFVDITAVIDRKLEALKSHFSQHQDPDRLDELIRGWGAMVARLGGLPDGRHAEAFFRVDTA